MQVENYVHANDRTWKNGEENTPGHSNLLWKL